MDYILSEPEINYKTGYIKIYRSILDHELFNEHRQYSKLEAWLDILLVVNYEEQDITIKGYKFKVGRGETIRSLSTWATRWRWDKNKVRRFFTALENRQMIDTQTDTQIERFATHLKVCNYGSYQDKKTQCDTQPERKPTPNNKYKVIKKDIYGDFSFFNNGFDRVWNDFLKMRIAIRHKLTTEGELLLLKKLSDLSNNNKEVAIKIVEQSIEKSWRGLFELKTNFKQQNKSSDGVSLN